MDAIIVTAITAPFVGAITVLWRFVINRFSSLEKAHRECQEKNRKLELRLDNFITQFYNK